MEPVLDQYMGFLIDRGGHVAGFILVYGGPDLRWGKVRGALIQGPPAS